MATGSAVEESPAALAFLIAFISPGNKRKTAYCNKLNGGIVLWAAKTTE